ncbi:hypothetical protein BGX26_011768 [Mortierella sp. AD094]|nr:hypothetical protein BGX26_011768 [Mortierella sp. AD094]
MASLNPPSGTATSAKQASAAVKVEEPDFYSTMWPEDPSDNKVTKFNRGLVAMSTVDLNQLNHSNYPKWARREIDRERYQRKYHAGAVNQSSRTIPIGMGQPSPQENHVSLAAKEPSPREEMDADFFHEALAAEATYSLTYDKSLTYTVKTKNSKYGSRSIFGMFTCTKKCQHKWISGKVAVELWLRVDTGRYRVVLHSQKCQRCERYAEPEIEVEAYVLKVIRTFDLWKGLRDSEERDPVKSTAPHDYDRCHGCEKGICPKLLELLESLNDDPLLESKGTSYPILFRLLNMKPHVLSPYQDLLRFLKENRNVFRQ